MTTMITDRIHLDSTRLKDLEEALANSTALQAAVGAGDLAVEKIRAAQEELVNRTMTFDSKAFRDEAQATFIETLQAIQAEVMGAPEQVKALPEKAQEWPARAQSLFADVISAAFSTYGELANRGKTIVTQVRRESPTFDDVVPVSRPTTGTATKTTRTTTTTKTANQEPAAKKTASQQPAAKKTAVKKTAVKKTAVKEPAAKKTTKTATKATTAAKRPTSRSTAATSATSKTTTSAAKKTSTPVKKSASTRN